METPKRVQVISFFVLLFIVLGLVFTVVRPFLNVLVLGGILAILFQPVYTRFLRKWRSPGLAALCTVGVIVLILLIPTVIFGQLVFNEVLGLYHSVRDGSLHFDISALGQSLPASLQSAAANFALDTTNLVGKISGSAFQSFSYVVSHVASFVLSLFLVLFVTYYLLKDGQHFKQVFIDISPIATSQENILFTKLSAAINGVVKGSFLLALIQGSVATVGFFIFGVPNPILWGVATVVAALVPTVGTSLSITPAVAYLLLSGHTGSALGMTIWGALAVGLIDNIVGPRVVGSAIKLHPLLVLLSVLGGVTAFGFIGFLLGPILMAVLVAMVDMYRTDFRDYLHR